MSRVLLLISDGFEEIEALGTVDILRRLGVNVDIKSIQNKSFAVSSRNIKIETDVLKEIDDNYDALILPGGQPNASQLREDKNVRKLISSFNSEGKLVCAICAAPSCFELLPEMHGRKITSYPGCVDESLFDYKNERVVVDENLITANGPASACDFAFTICEKLGLPQDKIEAVRNGMMF